MSKLEGEADSIAANHLPDINMTPAEIIDLERSQIGHDLHDTLLPLVFAASANLQSLIETSSLGDPSVSDRIAKANDWLQQAMAIGRNLLTQIYPPELDRLSWLVAAKDTAERICGDQCEVTWTVDSDSPVCDPHWNRDVATSAYRVLIESLRNAIRHGKAEAISIRCKSDRILIVDDGQGFDPSSVDAGRFGIRSMKGRAQLVSQRVTVASQPGGPTTVQMTV